MKHVWMLYDEFTDLDSENVINEIYGIFSSRENAVRYRDEFDLRNVKIKSLPYDPE